MSTRHLFTIELVVETALDVDLDDLTDAVDTAMTSITFLGVLYSHAVSVGVDPDTLDVERADITYEGELGTTADRFA